jgi:hypothetical protein
VQFKEFQANDQDADNNTILHLLASIPSPPTHSPHTHLLLSSPSFPPRPSTKSLAVQISTSLRMTHLYHTLFPFLLDWSNSGGKTALHVAAQAGNTAFINLLCDVGADVDLTDLQGNTPLHYASAWGHVETIRVLLERGCQFGARNFEGFTASDFAYSATVMGSIQTIARELLEERRNRRKAEAESYSNPPQGRLRSGSASTNLSNGSGLSANMVSPTGGVAAVDRRLGIMTSEGDLERPANSYFSNRLGNGRDPNHSPGGPSPTSASPNLQPGSLAPGGFSMRRGDSAQTGSESSYSQAPPNKRMASAPGGRGTPI